MAPAVIAALVEAGVAVAQSIFNVSTAKNAEQRQENYYNKYSNPVAQREQLRNAGLSDSAIGQALSGFNGAGTTVQAYQPAAPDFSASIGELLNQYNQLRTTDKDIEQKTAEIEFTQKNKEKLANEIDKLKTENDYNKIQLDILEKTKQMVIDGKQAELKNIVATAKKAQYDVKEAKWRYNFLKAFGIPYDGGKYVREIALGTSGHTVKKIAEWWSTMWEDIIDVLEGEGDDPVGEIDINDPLEAPTKN